MINWGDILVFAQWQPTIMIVSRDTKLVSKYTITHTCIRARTFSAFSTVRRSAQRQRQAGQQSMCYKGKKKSLCTRDKSKIERNKLKKLKKERNTKNPYVCICATHNDVRFLVRFGKSESSQKATDCFWTVRLLVKFYIILFLFVMPQHHLIWAIHFSFNGNRAESSQSFSNHSRDYLRSPHE